MKARRTSTTPARQDTSTVVSLDQLERMLTASAVRVPPDAVLVRHTSRALHAMSSGCDFATITCESGDDGVRITGGREALEVALVLRARASWRGDHIWARELGRHLRFHVVRASQPSKSRRFGTKNTSRPAARSARLAAG